MNYILLVAYYKLIEFCRRNRIYDGDCMIFVSERPESLCVRPVSNFDDEYTDHYIREMVLMFQRDVPRDAINVERIEKTLLEAWKRQLGSQDIEEGLHIFHYVQGRLMVMTRHGMASLGQEL
jgi:hypothetical protein